jgi:hypothetical protein
MNAGNYTHLIFNKNIHWRKDSLSINVAGKSDYLPAEN